MIRAVDAAVTIVDVDCMHARNVEDHEVDRTLAGMATWPTIVTKLNAETETREGGFLKKPSIPFLDHVSTGEKMDVENTNLNTVKFKAVVVH